ncbi:unnamed protein product [Cylindrotheca closterium]|uniref:Calmodulin n=1 Tax=Cylindrotheca closterium TaxID=2856 RepID=A0AAD2JGN4_9STRA|nr:unnamed protein product [Cylindrotheca closterium]
MGNESSTFTRKGGSKRASADKSRGQKSKGQGTRAKESRSGGEASSDGKGADQSTKENSNGDSRRVVTMEPSAHTFAGTSSARRDRSEPVMITDALADVRVKYHINPKELGHGHYGVVRKCMDRETKEWFAIKSIRKSKVSKIEVLKREIQILKEVKHPNIIALIDVFEDAKYLHLVTELCTGGELFDRIIAKTQSAEGHFSEHDASQLVQDILDAIAYCHDVKGIVHRDLKPENFLFLTEAEDAPIKIIDFGLSRHNDANQGIMKTKVGTPYYVAPEVLRREYTKSCDIWSIGVITYILLCGYPPFYGDSDAEIFDSVRTGKFDFPSPEWDNISSTAKEFVRYLLQKDPRERPTALQAMNHRWIQMHASVDEKVDEKPSLLRNTDRGTTFRKFLAMQKLKKAALLAIASSLTQAEVGSLGDIFCRIDQSGDGVITLTELDDAISRGSFPQEIQADISTLKEELRLSDTDTFSWKAFLAATMDKSLVIREDKVKFAFDHFKHSDTDYLILEDFVAMFKSEAQAKEIFVFLDNDCDGKVSFEDFRNAMEENIEIENEE